MIDIFCDKISSILVLKQKAQAFKLLLEVKLALET